VLQVRAPVITDEKLLDDLSKLYGNVREDLKL
jgi:hypothetical protein